MDRLDDRATARVSGKGWASLRPQFDQISEILLGVAPDTFGELTTIYVKYQFKQNDAPRVYAVLWIKKTSEMVLGLALPPGASRDPLQPPPPGKQYPRLTAYLTITASDKVPAELRAWARQAYSHVRDGNV
jgi:hypothetical protein